MKISQYTDAAKWYNEALEVVNGSDDLDRIRNVKVKLGR